MLPMLTTNQKGVIAETEVMAAAVQAGIGVALPLNDERYDLVLDLRPRLLRVQCKWGAHSGDIVSCRLYTSRRGRDGLISRRYVAGELDAFAVYCGAIDMCYLLPAEDVIALRVVNLRLGPSRNNQLRGIRWARDYEFGATLARLYGPIAQLGERLAGSQKVGGSSPPGSTSERIARTSAGTP
jgi:hypothetical protein